MMRWAYWLATLALASGYAARSVAQGPSFPADFPAATWQHAPSRDPQPWSRESLLARFPSIDQLKDAGRAQVQSVLGQPGLSVEILTRDMLTESYADTYRLSDRNDRTLRLDYGSNGALQSIAVATEPCACPACARARHQSHDSALSRERLLRAFGAVHDDSRPLTDAALDRLLGSRGTAYRLTTVAGGRTWLQYARIWRMSEAPEQFFVTSGETPRASTSSSTGQPLLYTNFAVMTMSPECPM